MDAASIIASWKQRLIAMAGNPEYVFRDTPQDLIERHYRRLTTFVGYTESEVSAAEKRLAVTFPAVFRQFLLEMAESPGDLFRGSDLADLSDLEQFRASALDLMAETDPMSALPLEAIVFLFHQGYAFTYLLASDEFDVPPMQWTEGESEPRQIATTFAEMVDAELKLMEDNNREARKQGGYYLTLSADGGSSMDFPALNSGERPVDRIPSDKPWWQF